MKKAGRILALSAATLIFSSTMIYAGNIKGVVVDKSDKTPLISATIQLLSARDSSLVKGTVSDADGAFRFSGVSQGKYIVKTVYVGYSPTTNNAELKSASDAVDLGKIEVAENTIVLREAEVVGVRAEVKVMQDTVEYNTDSYKVQPNAVVEDLLKRLPGVEVGSDGKITAQGKEVTKILVDGKEFFSDDAKVASKNIPVEMVDKIQVVDRKSDLARLTGVDDGEDETVINLTVKKGMKQGWFGNATVGYGTDDRYTGNLMVNRFVNDNQFTILAGANNINEMAFSMPGDGRFRRFGGVNGVKDTQSLGLNFNIGNEEVFRVGGDLMYSHSNQKTFQKSTKEYLFSETSSFEDALSNSRDRTHNVRGNFRLRWVADSLNTFDFRPSFMVSVNDSDKDEWTRLLGIDNSKVSETSNVQSSNGTTYDLAAEMIWNYKFKNHPGRSFSIQGTYKFSNTKEDETTYSINEYFLSPDDNETRDQWTDNHEWSNRVGARLSWMEPLGDVKKARFLTFAYRMNYYFNNADRMVYDRNREYSTEDALALLENDYGIVTSAYVADAIAEEMGVLDEDQSNQFRNHQFTQQIRVGYQQNRSKYRLNFGVSVNPTMMRSENLINSDKTIPEHWVWNYAPYARLRYSFSKTNTLAFDYRGRSTSPTMTQMQPVPDESDPSKVVIGNPNLLPSFNHNIMIRYNNFNSESQRSIMAFAGVQVTQNSIISKTHFDSQTGKQTITYDNVNGVWNAQAMSMITSPIGNKGWRWTNNVFARYSNAVGFNNGARNTSHTFSVSETPSIAFRNDVIDIELRPTYTFQQTRNRLQAVNNSDIHNYGGRFDATYYTPFGLAIGTNLTYTEASGYSAGYDNSEWLWNAQLSYSMLKDKSLTVAVKAYDLLQQKKNVSRNVTGNYIEDREFNTITRYFMLTLSYSFTKLGKGTTQKDINYDGFGPKGPDGERPPMPQRGSRSGRGPMGPPSGF